MSKIAKAMADWLTYPAGQDALTYIETGDPAALRRIRRHSGGLFVPWVYHLTSAMADPDAMGDHDRRALRALVAMEAFDQIGSWLSEALGRAKGEESLHDLVRDELAEARVPAVMISAMTVAYVPNLVRAGRPSSAGRHLLSLSDADFAAAVKAAASLNQGIAQRDSFPRLADFLLGFAPERLGPLIPAMEMTPGLAEVILRKGADRVKPAAVDRLFELLGHKNKGDREAAAQAPGRDRRPRVVRAPPGCSRTARPTSAPPRCSCSRRPARPRLPDARTPARRGVRRRHPRRDAPGPRFRPGRQRARG